LNIINGIQYGEKRGRGLAWPQTASLRPQTPGLY